MKGGESKMDSASVFNTASWDARRWKRIRLSVPVVFRFDTAQEGKDAPAALGVSIDLSPGGVYLTTEHQAAISQGEILMVSISIPWEIRRLFPFSRIMGPSRVVRVDAPQTQGPTNQRGLALAFCANQMSMLGSVVVPV